MKKILSGLYVITNEQLMPENHFINMAEAALSAGARILQYRDKSTDSAKRLNQALALKNLCEKYHALFIINDDIDLAKEVNADGIHLGKNDLSLKQARQQLGNNKIIGVSCYNQLSLARDAAESGADYIAFGSFFGSTIKPDVPVASADLISGIKKEYAIPVCCIGGISGENHQPLVDAGADMLAVITDVFSATSTETIIEKCRQFKI